MRKTQCYFSPFVYFVDLEKETDILKVDWREPLNNSGSTTTGAGACGQLVLNPCLCHNTESLPFKLSPGVFENVPSLVDEEVKVAVIRDTLRLMDPLKKKRESQ